MMSQHSHDLQTVFLDHVRSKGMLVSIFLVTGIKLQGQITDFDTYSVALTRAGQTQVIYKQVISTILPGAPVALSRADEASL